MSHIVKTLLFFVLFSIASISLQAQDDIYIPFRKANLWGFADTTGKTVVLPAYDKVFSHKKNMFLVMQDKKLGVVTLKNYVIIPFQKSQRINLNEDHILQSKYGGKVPFRYYYSYSGKKTFPDNIIRANEIIIEDQKYYTLITKSGKQGFVKVKENFEGIEKWYIDTSQVKISNLNNEKYLIVTKDGVKSRFAPGKTKKEVDALSGEEEALIAEPELAAGGPIKKIEWKYISLLPIKSGNNFQLVKKIKRKNKSKVIYTSIDTLPEKYKNVHLFTSEYSFNQIDSLDYHTNHNRHQSFAFVTNKKGKQGLVNCHGKVVIPIIYDALDTDFLYRDCKKINIVAKKNGKWGLINYYNKTLIPFEYDRLFLNGMAPDFAKNKNRIPCFKLEEGIIAEKNGKFGVINHKGLITDLKYDAVNFLKNTKSFQLISDKKYGILQYNMVAVRKFEHQIVEPIFSIPIQKVMLFDDYLVGELRGAKNDLKGYVDLKGFNYFED